MPLWNKEAQPALVENNKPASWDLVISDMQRRDAFGAAKYKVRLQPNNGRDTLRDLYEELLDATVYARTLLFERDGK